ncbi:hypothetical protein [Thomasclavelia sp.]
MKKLLSVLLVFGLCLGLTGCGGSSKPDDMTDESYDTGIKILEITDKYLDGEIDKDEAANSIRSMMDDFSGDGIGDVKVEERSKQITSSLYISDSSVQKSRDNLAEALEK